MPSVNDHVIVQGVPGVVLEVDDLGPRPVYLVQLKTPTIRWCQGSEVETAQPEEVKAKPGGAAGVAFSSKPGPAKGHNP